MSSAITKYALHPSILSIKQKHSTREVFKFQEITEDTMIKEILALNSGKKVSGSIPIKALKLAAVECAPTLATYFNNSVVKGSFFPSSFKYADIVPIHKKGSTSDKANYRPISLLPTSSKVFERLIRKLLNII